jgi:hypothetical protein
MIRILIRSLPPMFEFQSTSKIEFPFSAGKNKKKKSYILGRLISQVGLRKKIQRKGRQKRLIHQSGDHHAQFTARPSQGKKFFGQPKTYENYDGSRLIKESEWKQVVMSEVKKITHFSLELEIIARDNKVLQEEEILELNSIYGDNLKCFDSEFYEVIGRQFPKGDYNLTSRFTYLFHCYPRKCI